MTRILLFCSVSLIFASVADAQSERNTNRERKSLLRSIFGERVQRGPTATPATSTSEPVGSSSEADSSEDLVDAAVDQMARAVEENPDLSELARGLLEGRESELESLAERAEQDPNQLLEEGQRLISDPASQEKISQALARASGESEMIRAQGFSEDDIRNGLAKAQSQMTQMSDAEKQGLVSQVRSEVDDPEAGSSLLRRVQSEIGRSNEPEAGHFIAQVNRAQNNRPGRPGGAPAPMDPVAVPIPRPQLASIQITRITAEAARFDAKENVVIFEGNVELDHHDMTMECNVLEAELLNSAADANQAAAQASSPGGIKRATARGFVFIEKMKPDGGVQVAKARHAVYDALEEQVVLSDFPQLQDGQNLVSGRNQTTKIFLKQNGQYKVEGLADFEIVTPRNELKRLGDR
ncbi:MAG: LptA/OstA family protein [Verrucomicrobiota bacterium]